MPLENGVSGSRTLSDARATALGVVAHSLALDLATVEVFASLREAGVRSILIKGPSIARWLYDDPSERRYGDIDLLVAPEQLEAAEAGLRRLGFYPVYDGRAPRELDWAHALPWRKSGDVPVEIDLHRQIFLVPAPPATTWHLLSRDTQPLAIGARAVDTLADSAKLLLIALHAAHHGPERAQPIEDLRRAMARVGLDAWLRAATLAKELGAAGAMREGLRLATGGSELATKLCLPDDATKAVRLHAREGSGIWDGIGRLLDEKGWQDRLSLGARELAPSLTFMRTTFPLARRGPLGLVLAYLWRPVQLVLTVPRGARVWLEMTVPNQRRRKLAPFLIGAGWATWSAARCRRQLRSRSLGSISLPLAPDDRPGTEHGIHRGLRWARASCLEASLVRQRWRAATGRPRDLVIGVRGGVEGFAAHSWLEGDTSDAQGFLEISRVQAKADSGDHHGQAQRPWSP